MWILCDLQQKQIFEASRDSPVEKIKDFLA